MLTKPSVNIPCAVIISACLGLSIWSAYAVFQHQLTSIYAENALLENLQASLLSAAGLLFLANATLTQRPDKAIMLFFSVLCLAFVLREVDVERLDVASLLILVGSGTGRTILLFLAFLAIVVYSLLHFSYYQKAALAFARSKPGRLLMVALVFLIAGEAFEHAGHIFEHHQFYEEALELWGYSFILLSSCFANPFLRRLNTQEKPRTNL
jgi:hypothetical protein